MSEGKFPIFESNIVESWNLELSSLCINVQIFSFSFRLFVKPSNNFSESVLLSRGTKNKIANTDFIYGLFKLFTISKHNNLCICWETTGWVLYNTSILFPSETESSRTLLSTGRDRLHIECSSSNQLTQQSQGEDDFQSFRH